MSFNYIRELPSPDELRAELPLSPAARASRDDAVRHLQAIIRGEEERLLLIIGPCSADNEEALLVYTERLAALQDRVRDRLMLVPRVYGSKPRTLSEGYLGMDNQPDPLAAPSSFEGLWATRHMHLRVLGETGLVPATEMLYPGNFPYLDDCVGYVAVGARSVENQQHRLTASGLDLPVGMKNGTGGSVDVMFNAIHAAQAPHDFIYQGWEVSTEGNPFAHGVLRGGVDAHGRTVPNYYFEDLLQIASDYAARGLANPTLIVDTNHANSGKRFEEQPRIASDVLHSLRFEPLLRRTVKGFMVESYLEPGAQPVDGGVFGRSITDPCLGWPETERMILDLAEMI